MLFMGRSRMWVRYHDGSEQKYGQLEGFFRMRADYFQPKGFESFAYARPKLTVANGGIESGETPVNNADGGFLSYDYNRNFYANDGGANYTKSIQYPYTNVMEIADKGDMTDYRMWTIPEITGQAWYVDGRTSGTGVNDMTNGRGLYPDMPKLTISAADADGKRGIYFGAKNWEGGSVTFDQEKDAIYVVGAVSSTKELLVNATGVLNTDVTKPLRLYRYPGGHTLSPSSSTTPGANYKALLEVEACGEGESLTLNHVVVDGLFGYEGYDPFNYAIPSSFVQTNVEDPLVIAHAGSVLNMRDSTTLMHGYNNKNANNYWYHDADYVAPANVYHGGGLFVDASATVNVRDSVFITGNKQCRMVGELDHAVECNVYLPTFETHLNITGKLADETHIGVTSPKRNTAESYKANTFSPVAAASNAGFAQNAWINNNFTDDQSWFFTREGKSTYYIKAGKIIADTCVYFGWTWANVVRGNPGPTSRSRTRRDWHG